MKLKKIKGFTLIETLIVITVGIVFIALAITVYGFYRDNNNVRNETENISLIYNKTMDLFSSDTLNKFDTKGAIEIGIIPQKMKVLGETVKNAWGGDVTVTGDAPSKLTLTTSRVPAGNVCIELVRNQAEFGWTDYDVGGKGGSFKDVAISDLSTNCKGSGTKTIEFKYDLSTIISLEDKNLSLIYNKTMDLFSSDTLNKFDTKGAIEIGIIPQKMKVLGETVKNAWGGDVTVTGDAPSTLTLTTSRVPAGIACFDLVWKQSRVGWTHYEVGGEGGAFEDMQFTDWSTNCSGSGTKTIEFKYDGRQVQPTSIESKGKWKVSVDVNPIDDSNTVTLVLKADSGKNRRGDPVFLVARCQSNSTDLYINWKDYLGSKADVITRIGDNKAVIQRWSMSNDKRASFYPEPIPFLKEMLTSPKLVAQVTPYNENPITAIFNTAGLENAIKPLRETCSW